MNAELSIRAPRMSNRQSGRYECKSIIPSAMDAESSSQ